MNAMPIAWHEECLKNAKASTERKREELQRLQEEIRRNDLDNSRYEIQIETAKEMKKICFDRERFMKGK